MGWGFGDEGGRTVVRRKVEEGETVTVELEPELGLYEVRYFVLSSSSKVDNDNYSGVYKVSTFEAN